MGCCSLSHPSGAVIWVLQTVVLVLLLIVLVTDVYRIIGRVRKKPDPKLPEQNIEEIKTGSHD